MFPKRYYNSRGGYNDEIFPYNRVKDFNEPRLTELTTRPMNTCPYIQNTVYEKDGIRYIRNETDYELMNCIIHPEVLSKEDGLEMTPKRLAADPGNIIKDYYGLFYNVSDSAVRHNTIRFREKRASIYRGKRWLRPKPHHPILY